MTTATEADAISAKLHETTDAMAWTQEFDRIYPNSRPDNDTMLGWFANAIEVGRTAGYRAANVKVGEAGLREAALNLRNQALPPSMGHEWYCVRPKDFAALRTALATPAQPRIDVERLAWALRISGQVPNRAAALRHATAIAKEYEEENGHAE